MIRRSLRVTLALLAPILFLLALGLLTLRVFLPQWDGLAALVEHRVEALIDREVELGSLRVGWSGWTPELVASEVRIAVPDGNPLVARELGVSLAPLRSLRAGAPVLGQARLTGIDLRIERDEAGIWDVHGWRFGGTGSLAIDWSRHFSGMERLQIENASLEWMDAVTGIQTGLHVAVLMLRSDRSGLRLMGEGDFVPEAGGAVKVGIKVPPTGPDRIEFFLDAQDLQLPYWSGLGGHDWGSVFGTSAVRVWATLDNGRVRSLEGEHDSRLLAIRDGRWQGHAVGHRFQWRRESTEVVSQWVATTPGAGDARLEYRLPDHDEGLGRVVIGAAAVDLQLYAWPLAGLRFSGIPDLGLLKAADPSGRLDRVYLELVRPGTDWRVKVADAEVRSLKVRPTGQVPGVVGLDAILHWDADQGAVVLDGRDLVLEMPALFSHELWLNRLQARLAAQRDESGWSLTVRDMFATNEDATLEGRGRIDLGSAPHLDLALRFLRAEGSQVAHYLPVHRLPAKTYRWLVESIREGKVTDGGMVFHGNPFEFPFVENQGVFDVWAVVEDGRLDYQRGWPEATELSGTLLFHNAGFRVEQGAGRILDSTVSDTTVMVGNMLKEPELEIRGQAQGPVRDLPAYLFQAGITGGFGPYLAGVRPVGRSTLDLNLLIPLHGKGPSETRAGGRLRLDGAALELPEGELEITRIEGLVDFDPDSGIRGQGIRSIIHGEPVVLDLRRDAAGASTFVHARGRQPMEPWIGSQRVVQGTAYWNAEITVEGGGDSWLELSSDLEGVQLDLPPPLAKTRGTRRPLRISWPLRRENEAMARVRFDQVLEADLRVLPRGAGQPGEIRGVAVNLGRPPPGMPLVPARGVDLQARLEQVDVDAWLNVLAGLTMDHIPVEAGAGLSLVRADVDIRDNLRWRGQHLPGTRLRLEPRPDGRWLHLSSEWIEGEALLKDPDTRDRSGPSPGHWLVDLERLHLGSWAGSADHPTPDQIPDGLTDPRAWPALDLRVADLRIDKLRLVDTALELKPLDDGLELRQLRLYSPKRGVNLVGAGSWTVSAAGESVSRVSIEAVGTDWGEGLGSMGISPAMERGRGDAKVRLSWPGMLFVPNVSRMHGTVEISVEDGRLRDVEPGAGRLLGLVSLDVIPRRLRLDFRDVYTQGLIFDQIVGKAVIDGGDLLVPELRISSPSAVVRVSGRTGLIARDFDQHIVVVPRLRSTLPIVGALLGGPVTGAVVLLVERALGIGDQIEEAARVEYFVSGSWSDPQIRARVNSEQGIAD